MAERKTGPATRLATAVILALALLAGCAAAPDEAGEETGTGPLAGTSWQLVAIQWMDDTTAAPGDPHRYTLRFGADGTVSILADCNRATGSWTSAPGSRLEFGRLAATQALCPPESLSERFLAQFPWVRSYVIEDGRLFLATMADGSIVEFEPLAPARADDGD